MDIADGIMVSRFQAHEFAWISFAEGTFGRLLDVFIAFLIGGLALVPRHFSQGDVLGARTIWLRTLLPSIAFGAAGILVCFSGTSLLTLLGQPHELAQGAGPVMAVLSIGFPAAMLAISAAVYLEGINEPHFVAISVASANVLNIALNWVWIGGHFGFSAMGARGSAWSTTVVRCALGIALVGYAWKKRGGEQSSSELAHAYEREASYTAQWSMGISGASTSAAMIGLSSSLTVFASWLGILPLAAFAAAQNLAAPVALVGLGMSDAAGICVAAEAGRSGNQSAWSVAWASLRVTLVPVLFIVLLLGSWAQTFAALYTNDSLLRVSLASVIPIVCLCVMTDCFGFVMSASLRALRESSWPMGIDIGCLVLLVPLSMSLAFWRGYGVRGLFLAMLAVGGLRASLLAWRFWWRTRGSIPEAGISSEKWSLNA